MPKLHFHPIDRSLMMQMNLRQMFATMVLNIHAIDLFTTAFICHCVYCFFLSLSLLCLSVFHCLALFFGVGKFQFSFHLFVHSLRIARNVFIVLCTCTLVYSQCNYFKSNNAQWTKQQHTKKKYIPSGVRVEFLIVEQPKKAKMRKSTKFYEAQAAIVDVTQIHSRIEKHSFTLWVISINYFYFFSRAHSFALRSYITLFLAWYLFGVWDVNEFCWYCRLPLYDDLHFFFTASHSHSFTDTHPIYRKSQWRIIYTRFC